MTDFHNNEQVPLDNNSWDEHDEQRELDMIYEGCPNFEQCSSADADDKNDDSDPDELPLS